MNAFGKDDALMAPTPAPLAAGGILPPEEAARIPSPALLLLRDRVEANLDRMMAIARDPDRLRPHIKTHKCPQIVAMQVGRGIFKCKTATIAEAEMAAGAGATDIIFATQPVGPNVSRLMDLIDRFPSASFRTILDDVAMARALSAAAVDRHVRVDALVDIDVGQHRTGVLPGSAALELCRVIESLGGLSFGGLHAYDGHLALTNLEERDAAVARVWEDLEGLRERLATAGLGIPRVVVGGTPTFPLHARRPNVECSPGTSVLWDAGYSATLPDLQFEPAAVLLARVISRPSSERLCLDLGHKAVASEMPHPRVAFPQLPDARAAAHSEEHLVLETSHASEFPVGSILYGIPWHICPTVALHEVLYVVDEGRITGEWAVVARRRRLEI